MFLIQPCCTQKNLLELRRKLGADGTCLFHGYGDLSLSELLPPLLTRYGKAELVIAVPFVPDALARTLTEVMEKEFPAVSGGEMLKTVSRLTLIANLRKNRSPMASQWLKENPFGERLEIRNIQQNDTAVILPDIALKGPINLSYGGHFTALATKRQKTIQQIKDELLRLK